jgi:hypothetical protein
VSRLAAAAAAAGALGCGGEIIPRIEGSLPVPEGVDAICLGIADVSAGGGAFGRGYRLAGAVGLPQTLRRARRRGRRVRVGARRSRGVPVARAPARCPGSVVVTP